MDSLAIALLQIDMKWELKNENFEYYRTWFDRAEQADIYILPEMFSTGFSMRPSEHAEPTESETLKWVRSMAKEKNAAITGSFIAEENGKYFNRLFWVEPGGKAEFYDKRHLFSLAGEEKVYAPGKNRLITDYRGWKICPLVCYDLRFPVWSRNRISDSGPDYDLLIYVANWPERRNYAWKHLLIARAIENQSFVAGVNRVGLDGNGVMHSGDSAILHPDGSHIATAEPREEQWLYARLEKAEQDQFRQRFQFLKDQSGTV